MAYWLSFSNTILFFSLIKLLVDMTNNWTDNVIIANWYCLAPYRIRSSQVNESDPSPFISTSLKLHLFIAIHFMHVENIVWKNKFIFNKFNQLNMSRVFKKSKGEDSAEYITKHAGCTPFERGDISNIIIQC